MKKNWINGKGVRHDGRRFSETRLTKRGKTNGEGSGDRHTVSLSLCVKIQKE